MLDKDKELKMELLMKLMESMDDSIASRLKKSDVSEAMEGEPIAVVEEKKVMPASEAKEMLMKKLSQPQEQDDEESASDDMMAEEDLDDGEDVELEEAEPMSRLQKRIAEGKKFREQMMKKRR